MKIKIIILLLALMLLAAACSQKSQVTNTEQITSQVASQANNDVFTNEPSCPRGVENDPAPGDCFQYTDTNDNGLCDLGE